MSFLGKIFGSGGGNGTGKSKGGPATPAEAINKLREVEQMLLKKQDFLEEKIKKEVEIIKKNGTTNKRVSIQALKRKKRIEKQLEQLDGTLTTIEYQRESLENANTNAEVLNIMGFAAKALKSSHNNMDLDKVEDLMDDVREQQQLADEISQVISNPTMFGQDVDESELLKELEEMEQEEIDRKLLDTEPLPTLPEVPTTVPKDIEKPGTSKEKKSVDDELAELAEWAK